MTPEERLYHARHRRNEARRGKAKLLKCVDCAAAGVDRYARDWSHRHGTDPDDVMNYDPRCRKCHIAYDPTAGHRVPHSEETKALLSQKNTGYVHTPEAVEKIRAAATGRKHTPESIAKMSVQKKAEAAARGPMPEEQRAKISASLRKGANGETAPRAPKGTSGRPPGNPNLGKTRAAQQRAKTHCDQNHELTPDNIYWRGPDKKNRQCKTCTRERAAARYLAQREAAASVPRPPSRRGGARPGTGDPELGRRYADRQLSKTHCPAGHEYSEENTYIIKRAGGRTARQCKTCTKAKARGAGGGQAQGRVTPPAPGR
jgi:hypothetical protein